MEFCGAILEILKCVGLPVCTCVQYHWNLDETMENLGRILQELNSKKEDIEARLKVEHVPGKIPKNEVVNWLGEILRIDRETQTIEEEVNKRKFFSRARLGKLAEQKIAEVKEYHQKGCSFTSLVIDVPPPSGLMLPTTTLAGERDKEILEQIWKHLMSDKVKKIGVYGMGGVGKTTIITHINNRLQEENNKFNHVIWVTVSQTLDVLKLQNDIAIALHQKLPEDEDKIKRAGKLLQMLKQQKRYVLILDDMWKEFPLHEVGIPEPTEDNECKLVITTRSCDVCRSMGCEQVKVEPLSEQEALNLFLDKVGQSILQVPTLKEIVYAVVEQCAGLPLAIVTIAASMKGIEEIHQWKNALNELSGHVRSVEMNDEVFGRLEFSYNRLKDENVQHCFLYCALYPEDHKIPKDELIGYWIPEGFVDDMDNVQAKYDRGYTILDRLINSCLLESADKGCSVKVHDVIRDMAFRITSKSPLFMIKAGINLQKFPSEQEWKENLEKVSLMRNDISEIPSNMSPKCQTLSTLLLQRNEKLQRIPECFFVHMLGLKVLDLSYTGINDLPNSVSDLINLKSLSLGHCKRLQRIPSLAKLLALQHLDLGDTSIREVPEGLEMLENLHYLNLLSYELKQFPAGILPKLHRLFKLRVYLGYEILRETVEEAVKLSNQLDDFQGHFSSVNYFNICAKSLGVRGPKSYCLVLDPERTGPGFAIVDSDIGEEKLCRFVSLSECRICEREDPIVLPKDIQYLYVTSIYDLSSFNDIFPSDQKGIICTYSSLKAIHIAGCDKLTKLLSPQLLSVLQHLETIEVRGCDKLEEIIAFNVDDEGEEGNRKKELGRNTIPAVTLPRLKTLVLSNMPALKFVCSNNGVMVCNSLEEIKILFCPNLKRLSLSVPVGDNGEPSPIPTLKGIGMESKIWESLEWDQPNVKNVLNHYYNTLGPAEIFPLSVGVRS